MVMSAEDIEAFIAELQRDPQLRDRARNVILADDFLELPKIVVRLGNLEGRLYEMDYRNRLPARLGRRYLKVRSVHIPDVDRVNAAFASHHLVDADWDDLLQIDAAAWANRRLFDRQPEPHDVLVVL